MNKPTSLLTTGLIALTAIALAAPNSLAHNPAKYVGVPFSVAAYCTNIDPSVNAGFVSYRGQNQLNVVADAGGWSGFEIYSSIPGSNNNAYANVIPAPTPFAPLPLGTVTFNMTGLPSSGQVIGFAYYNNSSGPNITNVTPVNGVVTLPALGISGSTGIVQIQVYIATTTTADQNATGAPYANVTISNIRFNNQPVLADLTFTDHSTNTSSGTNPIYGYCLSY